MSGELCVIASKGLAIIRVSLLLGDWLVQGHLRKRSPWVGKLLSGLAWIQEGSLSSLTAVDLVRWLMLVSQGVWALIRLIEALHLNVWIGDWLTHTFIRCARPLRTYVSIVQMYLEGWVVIFSLLLHQFEIIISQCALWTCRSLPTVLGFLLERRRCFIHWLIQFRRCITNTLLIMRTYELLILSLLSTPSRILTILKSKHGLDSDTMIASYCPLITSIINSMTATVAHAHVGPMHRDWFKLEVLALRLIEAFIGYFWHAFHLRRRSEYVFSSTLNRWLKLIVPTETVDVLSHSVVLIWIVTVVKFAVELGMHHGRVLQLIMLG